MNNNFNLDLSMDVSIHPNCCRVKIAETIKIKLRLECTSKEVGQSWLEGRNHRSMLNKMNYVFKMFTRTLDILIDRKPFVAFSIKIWYI